MRDRTDSGTIRFDHFRIFTYGSAEELVEAFGSMNRAREAWVEVRDEFLESWDLWGMPSAWWHFEPGVPDEIRRGPHAIITDSDADRWHRIEMERRRHLVSRGIDPAPQRTHTRFGPA